MRLREEETVDMSKGDRMQLHPHLKKTNIRREVLCSALKKLSTESVIDKLKAK